MVPLKLSWTPKQIALLTVVPRSHCGPKTVISNVVFARVSLQPIITCGSTRVAGAFSPKKNNVIPDNDRLSTCYFFSVLQRPVPKFFSVTVPHHRHRCSLHRHRCSTALFAVIAATPRIGPPSTVIQLVVFGKSLRFFYLHVCSVCNLFLTQNEF